MKGLSFLLLSACLLLVSACDTEDAVPNKKGYMNPLSCLEKSSGRCDVDWIISFARESYPDTIQIVINNKVVVDDCDGRSYWTKNQTGRFNEYTIHEYQEFDCDNKFSMRIFDRKDCYSKKEEHSFTKDQSCSNKVIGGQKQIWVEKN